MTVIVAGQHAWMPAFCPGCEKLVHFQKEDVLKGYEPVDASSVGVADTSGHSVGAVLRYYIVCKCGHQIEIARA